MHSGALLINWCYISVNRILDSKSILQFVLHHRATNSTTEKPGSCNSASKCICYAKIASSSIPRNGRFFDHSAEWYRALSIPRNGRINFSRAIIQRNGRFHCWLLRRLAGKFPYTRHHMEIALKLQFEISKYWWHAEQSSLVLFTKAKMSGKCIT